MWCPWAWKLHVVHKDLRWFAYQSVSTINPESFVAEMLPEFDIVTRSNADHSELRILRQMSGRVCGKLWKCGARLVDRVPDRHGDPDGSWEFSAEANASTTTVAFLDSLYSTSSESRQALKHLQTSSNLSKPQWNFSSLSLQCWISVE